MPGGCAIYIGDNQLRPRANPFGKDVANRNLYRALIRHGPWDEQLFLAHQPYDPEELAANLFDGAASPKPVRATSILNHAEIAARGVLLRGQANIAELSWQRRGNGERDYSFVGLIHSLASQGMRAYTAEVLTSPIEPWDALICTSPTVERHLRAMLTEGAEYLSSRFAPAEARRPPPLPHLPVIPLGIDTAGFAARGDRSRRSAARQKLGIADDAFALLWVGRLSFFEKAYPQGMFAAAEETAQRTGRPVVFLLTGWVPGGEEGLKQWVETAALYAPSVDVRFLNGNNLDILDVVWPASDVFVSMVDNVQETFGITPIEAMASGLPVVVSDWDGYRFTVPEGVTGFRVPTMIPPAGTGALIADRHALAMDTYQLFGAQTAAHVAVNVRVAADALETLARDPERATAMGAAGREHARRHFDWAAVIPQYASLFDELADLRRSATAHEQGPAPVANPIRNDPYAAFADFATDVLSPDTRLRLANAVGPDVTAHHRAAFNNVTRAWRLAPQQSARILRLIGERAELTVGALMDEMADAPRENLQRHLVWMCKVGLIDWAPGDMVPIDEKPDSEPLHGD